MFLSMQPLNDVFFLLGGDSFCFHDYRISSREMRDRNYSKCNINQSLIMIYEMFLILWLDSFMNEMMLRTFYRNLKSSFS